MDELERSILFYADAHARARVRGAAGSSTPSLLSDADSSSGTQNDCGQLMRVVASAERRGVNGASRCHLWATCGARGRARDRSERGGGEGAP